MIDLKSICERAEKATESPWKVVHEMDGHNRKTKVIARKCVCRTDQQFGRPHHTFEAEANADFIAHARQDIPALLEHIKTLTDALQEIKECTELLYDGNRLYPELRPHSGPINVICKVTQDALKAGEPNEP